MRRALILAFLFNIALGLLSLSWLPERVAIHFGPQGVPNGWASREVNAALILLTQLLLFGTFFALPWLLERLPARWINMPRRDYWLAPERARRTRERIVRFTDEFGVATLGFLAVIALLTIDANRTRPVRLDEGLFLVTLAAYLLYMLAWTIRFILAFRRRPAR